MFEETKLTRKFRTEICKFVKEKYEENCVISGPNNKNEEVGQKSKNTHDGWKKTKGEGLARDSNKIK